MPERTLTIDELTGLLERFPLDRAGGRTSEDMSDAHVQHLLKRIAAVTDAIRGLESSETTRLASRVLLDDLATVAAQFRGRANGAGASLAKALDALQHVLAHTGDQSERAREP